MIRLVLLLLGSLRALVRRRSDLVLENLALRQQVAAFAAKGGRPRITGADRWFWTMLRRCWSRWTEVLVFVKPETVARWHRAGFRRYWTWLSRRGRRGRPRTRESLRSLIRRMATENAGWGAPRIHGELLALGFVLSERTVSRYLPRQPASPDVLKRWLTFPRLLAGDVFGYLLQHQRGRRALGGGRTPPVRAEEHRACADDEPAAEEDPKQRRHDCALSGGVASSSRVARIASLAPSRRAAATSKRRRAARSCLLRSTNPTSAEVLTAPKKTPANATITSTLTLLIALQNGDPTPSPPIALNQG